MMLNQTTTPGFTFSTAPAQNAAPAAPPTLAITSAEDGQTGFFAPDFPCVIKGVETGKVYLSRLVYVLHAGMRYCGDAKAAEEIYALTQKALDAAPKDGTYSLEPSKQAHAEAMRLFRIPEQHGVAWGKKCLEMMSRAMAYSIMQNDQFLNALLATENKIILYVSPDQFWGTGSNDANVVQGNNFYGQILMFFREKAQKKELLEFSWAKLPPPKAEVAEAPKAEDSFPRPENPPTQEEEKITIEDKIEETPVQEIVEEAVVNAAPAPVVAEAPKEKEEVVQQPVVQEAAAPVAPPAFNPAPPPVSFAPAPVVEEKKEEVKEDKTASALANMLG